MVRRIIYSIVIAFLSLSLQAQTFYKDLDYNNPKEYKLGNIKFEGADYLDVNALKNISGLKEGMKVKLPGSKITNAMKKLWKQGLFADVKVAVDKIEGESLDIKFYLKVRVRLSKIRFSGVKKSRVKDLKEAIGLRRGTQLTDSKVNKAILAIKKFYIKKRYLNVEVKPSFIKDTTFVNSAILKFRINKKGKIRINEIFVHGNNAFTDGKVRRSMKKTKRYRWFNIFRSAKFIEDEYEADKMKVLAKYNDKGYRNAKLVKDTMYFVSDNRINIELTVDEGEKFFIRDIKWLGNKKYNSTLLSHYLKIKPGDVYSQKTLDERLTQKDDAVGNMYMNNGYLFFRATPVETKIDKDSVDLEIRIMEGPPATIDKVIIKGNTRTHEHVIRRELFTKPGELFSKEKLIRSHRELMNLKYFNNEAIDILPLPDVQNGTVDIQYTLEEVGSDQIELSGGWGGGMIIGSLGLSFNNFSTRNILNKKAWHPLPMGDGQKLSFHVRSNGSQYQSYSASFMEPWFGGKKPISLSLSVHHTIQTNRYSNYTSYNQSYYNNYSYYNQVPQEEVDRVFKTTGFSIGIGQRLKVPDDFFTLYTGINFERYDMKNWYSGLMSNGQSNNISFSINFGRNSVDNPIYPRGGSSFSLGLKATPPYSAFSNDDYDKMSSKEKYQWIEYHKWNFKSKLYYALVGDLVIHAGFELGYLGYYDKKLRSPFEGFTLGGDGMSGYSFYGTETIALRGYEERALTPYNQETGQEAGNLYEKLQLELRYPITLSQSANIYALVFAEGGKAWAELGDFEPFKINRAAGVGIRIFLPMLGQLGVDWGYGFDDVPYYRAGRGNGSQWSFILGQRF